MKRAWLYLCICVIMSCAFGNAEGAETTPADSLFEAALSTVGQASLDESIKAFEQVIRTDRKYVPAYGELAKLYMAFKTPKARQDAERAIKEAIRLTPDQVEYQVTYGELLRQKGFWHASDQVATRILETYPNYAPADYLRGEESLEQYLGADHAHRASSQYAKEDLERAEFHLGRCIALDPNHKAGYYKLGLLYLESDRPARMMGLMKRLLRRYPEDADGLLYCALGYRHLGDWTNTERYFAQALQHVEPALWGVMHDLEHIVTAAEQPLVIPAKAADYAQSRIERERFWRKQNPLILTEYNERILEHYSRVAYAKLRYSNLRRDIVGYETDQGKTYIRFGHPLLVRRGGARASGPIAEKHHPLLVRRGWASGPIDESHRNERDENPENRPRSDGEGFFDRSRLPRFPVGQSHFFSPPKETWYYEGFEVTFETYDVRGKWRFGGYTLEETLAMMDRGQNPIPSGSDVFKKQEPRFIDPYKQFKYQPPHLIAAFREGEHTRVELAYALPTERLDIRAEGVDLVDGLFLFDPHWDEVHRNVKNLEKLTPLGADSLRKSYLLAQHIVQVKPGTYNLVAELRDRRTNAIGAVRALHTCTIPDTGLAISDLLLASQIDTRTSFPESRRDLQITPNPLRTYTRSDPVFLYLELYNLTRDHFGRTHFDIAYRISLPDRREVDPGLFMALDARSDTVQIVSLFDPDAAPHEMPQLQVQYRLPKHNQLREELKHLRGLQDRVETTVSAEYEGDRADDFTFLEIDIHQLPAGIYALTVTISDRHTGQSVDQSLLFRVIE